MANNDTAVTDLGTPVTINLIANDRDADGDSLSIADCSIVSASGGTIVQNDAVKVTYTPAANFSGTDTFNYRCSDGQTASYAAAVTVTVQSGGSDNDGGGSGSSGCFLDTFLHEQ